MAGGGGGDDELTSVVQSPSYIYKHTNTQYTGTLTCTDILTHLIREC